jgi:IS5 family transposase
MSLAASGSNRQKTERRRMIYPEVTRMAAKRMVQETQQRENPRPNRGTLIPDATCVPQNIRFPTDVSLLNEGRELLEQMIDTAREASATEGRKPRTYRNNARRDWLRFARDRKPTRKKIRKAVRQQLGYVRRDLVYPEEILREHPEALSAKELE